MRSDQITLAYRDREHAVEILDGERVAVDGQMVQLRQEPRGTIRFDGRSGIAWTASDGDRRWVYLDGRVYEFRVREIIPADRETVHPAPRDAVTRAAAPRKSPARAAGSLAAPMPATVRRVVVAAGDTVKRGDTVVILEAMKMELPVRAPADGRVKAILCREGELVDAGEALVEITDSAD